MRLLVLKGALGKQQRCLNFLKFCYMVCNIIIQISLEVFSKVCINHQNYWSSIWFEGGTR